MEVADDQINDKAAVDAALEDQLVMTGSVSEMSLPLSTAGAAIFAFDLPIWLKAVDIIKQANINVIERLGGFHQLVLSWING